jgi:outer membrane protein TolC
MTTTAARRRGGQSALTAPAAAPAATSLRRTLPRVPAVALALALAGGLPHSAAAQSLEQVEAAALEHAQVLRLADTEGELAVQQLAAARANEGARVTLGSALAQAREPITDTAARDYTRASGLAGLRWPLLGTAEAAARDTEDATLRLEQQPWRRQQAQVEVLGTVRDAWVVLLRGRERQALARAWLQQEAAVAALLAGRTRAHLLLEADRLAFASMFDTARRDALREAQTADRALALLQRLTLLPLGEMRATAPDWSTRCLRREDILARADQRPPVAMAAMAVRARERQVDEARWAGVEAGVTLSQSLSHDFGALNGYATTVGVDVSMPLDWQAARNAQRTQRRLALEQARQALQARRDDDETRVQDVLATLALAESQWRAAAQALAAAREADRIARLRAATLEGDVLEHAVQARYALYRAGIEASESLQRYEQAQAAALEYESGTPCAPDLQGALPAWPQTLAAELVEPLPVVARSSPSGAQVPSNAPTTRGAPGAAATPPLAVPAPAPALAMPDATNPAPPAARADQPVAWLAWDGARWLRAPDPAALLPAAGTRLLVSFPGAEIARFGADATEAQRLRAWLDALHARGWRVDLLLGEPTWVLPPARAHLVGLLRALASFPFDGLALDLERSQLPQAEQAAWAQEVVATLREVHRADARPLTLVTHWREFARAGFSSDLRRAGVTEAMAMLYTTDLARATADATATARAAKGLPLVVVQSIERALPESESTFARGRAASIAQWRELAARLGAQPAFAGIAVQSLEDWEDAAP